MPKIRVFVSTSMRGSKVEDEFDAPDNWSEMTEEEREEFLDQAARDHLANCGDLGAYVVDDDE